MSVTAHFEKIVRIYPDRLALKADNASLTYGMLNRRASRVAQEILAKCGDSLKPIMVLTDTRPEATIACLGGMKAGKIIVAGDPSFPIDRLRFMAEDSKAEAVLTYGDNVNLGVELANQNRFVINIDALGSDRQINTFTINRGPDDPATFRYTSGSTGRPKGVIRTHRRNLFSYISLINSSYICSEDRIVLLRRISFNDKDTFSGLLVGATLFPFDIREQGILRLANFLSKEAISYFAATPSIFRHFAQELTQDYVFPDLRLIKLGGEPLFRADFELFKKYFSPSCVLLNQLSANEMGNICQYWMTKDTKIETPIVPVGYPIEDKKVVLIDESENQIGMNEVGEIAVASRYLSTGYWNDPELTTSKFLARKDKPDEPLYLSGDLGRMLPDGCVLHVGRKDDQVKIRGGKVELREVEAVLSEHPQIKQSVVVCFDRANGEKYLTAYLVSGSVPAPSVGDIKAYSRRKLPNYMIPSVVVFLDSLPLVNEKVDRKSLPKPYDTRPVLDAPYCGPRNETEANLVSIWEEIIGMHPIGIDNNFFDLGGHSLAATRVVSRVIKQFRIEIPLQSLFHSPTISDMAAVITAHQGKELDEQGLTELLEELESITEDDAKQMIDRQRDN